MVLCPGFVKYRNCFFVLPGRVTPKSLMPRGVLGTLRVGPHPLGDEKKEASRRLGLHSKRTSVSPLAGEKVTSRTPVLEKGKVVGVRKVSPQATPPPRLRPQAPRVAWWTTVLTLLMRALQGKPFHRLVWSKR
ncbi:hypothetical protein Pmani_019902 [Petrolisthes manimaculis]|uniref:Uncharacterized protein n=1 Tax=Petrolisthes manimaculis TaxID=1843537 RepID=A0AAE1PJH1_9EUCA|nr:hypothetical protein Pmani_019902 [Petrolisthes manimaculis]